MSKVMPLLLSALCTLALSCGAAYAAEHRYPSKPITKALKSPDMIEVLAKAGAEPLGNTPQQATEFLKVEIARWGKVIKQANVKIE